MVIMIQRHDKVKKKLQSIQLREIKNKTITSLIKQNNSRMEYSLNCELLLFWMFYIYNIFSMSSNVSSIF